VSRYCSFSISWWDRIVNESQFQMYYTNTFCLSFVIRSWADGLASSLGVLDANPPASSIVTVTEDRTLLRGRNESSPRVPVIIVSAGIRPIFSG
jgi:hypothetical protein